MRTANAETERTVLVIDDDDEIREALTDSLTPVCSAVHSAESAEAAMAMLATVKPDVVLSDVRMPGIDGLDLTRLLRERAPGISVLLMTAFDDLPTVSRGMREGAEDFLVKPLDLHHLRAVVERVFADRQARGSDGAATQTAGHDASPAGQAVSDAGRLEPHLIGHHPGMVEIFKVIGQVAGSDANVMIRGESGTGKELIARAIHAASPRSSEPFVAVNCTALPSTLLESELFGHVRGSFTGAARDRKGRFRLAGRGTLFLDEIGDTAPDFQSKLLRVLQEREYYAVGAETPETTEARVIAATHRDLEDMVRRGDFREDLYYRLRVVEIVVPPLRERLSDLRQLADHLVARASRASGRTRPVLAPETVAALEKHNWPGNVRELENCLTRAVVLATGGVVRPEHLALGPRSTDARHRMARLEEVERDHVAYVLENVGGNRTRAADVLGVSRPRIRRLIEKYSLEAEDDEELDEDPSGGTRSAPPAP